MAAPSRANGRSNRCLGIEKRIADRIGCSIPNDAPVGRGCWYPYRPFLHGRGSRERASWRSPHSAPPRCLLSITRSVGFYPTETLDPLSSPTAQMAVPSSRFPRRNPTPTRCRFPVSIFKAGCVTQAPVRVSAAQDIDSKKWLEQHRPGQTAMPRTLCEQHPCPFRTREEGHHVSCRAR